MTFALTVVGDPKPQGSKVGFIVNGRVVLKESGSKALTQWRRDVREAAKTKKALLAHRTFDGPVSVELVFYLRRPKAPKFSRHPAVAPDLDKLVRAVFDSLTQAKIFEDDSLVCELTATKKFALPDQHTGITCKIEPLIPRFGNLFDEGMELVEHGMD